MEGKVVNHLPPPGRNQYNWDRHALIAQKNTGKPVLAAKHVPDSKVKALRQYTRPPFRQDNGRIVVNVRNSQIEDDGIRYGDVYLTWQPHTEEEEK